MATETTVRVARARYGGFVATFTWNGQWNRVFFENALEVAAELADQCVDADTIEHVMDAFEQMEWSDSTYPLFMPAEAVCEVAIDEPVYDRHREAVVVARTQCQFWKSLCGIAAFSCGLAVFSLFVVLSRK